MLQEYKATIGQSMYDVCLNTYGTLNMLGKLMADNGIYNASYRPDNGQAFAWDNEQVLDVAVFNLGYTYVTARNTVIPPSEGLFDKEFDKEFE